MHVSVQMGLLLVVNMKIRSNKFLYTLNVARLNVLCTSRCRRLQRIFSGFWVIFMLFYFCTFALIGNCQRQANADTDDAYAMFGCFISELDYDENHQR